MDSIVEQLYAQYRLSHTVTTDSRTITPGCIFFAFKGENFDGNAFAPQALQMGAALCVVSNPAFAVDERCILVSDVMATLQQLARCHRAHLDIPVVGITGTNGKTTTKELVNAVLSKKYRTHATMGNFNNHLGVPLTLLSTPPDAELLVVEMGANHPGEIDFLCNIAQPDYGLITNVGKAHLAGFGSFEGVVSTKTELYRSVNAKNGTLFVNADNDILMHEARRLATIADVPSPVPGYIPAMMPTLGACHAVRQLSLMVYGTSCEADCKGSFVGCDPYMKFYFEDGDEVYTVQTQLLGRYNFDNAMSAVAVGRFFGVECFDIKEALEAYVPSNNRSQFKRTSHNALVLDCYNANPSSMKVALDNFEALAADHKVVMLGGMKELGAESTAEHADLCRRLFAAPFEQVVLVGDEFADLCRQCPPSVRQFRSVEAAADYLRVHPVVGATVLLKGSNSTRMWLLEEVL